MVVSAYTRYVGAGIFEGEEVVSFVAGGRVR